jgi:hypothetical protein
LREAGGYIDDAVSALSSDDDPGERRQQITELRRSGATNDEIRLAMQAA